jgi:hypothetical protein
MAFKYSRQQTCDTHHYLVAAKVRERLPVSKQAAQKNDMERLNLKKINDWEVRTEQHIKISNRVADVENLAGQRGRRQGLGRH